MDVGKSTYEIPSIYFRNFIIKHDFVHNTPAKVPSGRNSFTFIKTDSFVLAEGLKTSTNASVIFVIVDLEILFVLSPLI